MSTFDFTFDFLDDPQSIILSTFGTVIAVALCSGGGIGGGGILVPLYILLDGYDEHHAVPLSKVVIFGAAFIDFFLYRPLRHPTQRWRTLIGYDLAVIMEPLILGGTIVGVILNVVLPTLVVGVLLILLLGYTSLRMFRKAKDIRAKEMKEIEATSGMHMKRSRGASKPARDLEAPLMKNQQESTSAVSVAQQGSYVEGGSGKSVQGDFLSLSFPSLSPEPKWEGFPKAKGLLLLTCWLTILGSAVGKDVVDCGSAAYWVLTFCPFPILIAVTFLFGKFLVRKHRERPVDSYVKGDIMWDEKNVMKYPLMSSVAGVAAALLGVGGGMVTGPLFLELGVLPEVSRVTSAFMILFTSSCTSMQYLILGRIRLDQAIWYGGFGFVGAVLGHWCVEWAVKKYKSTSVLVTILAWAVLLSAIAMGSVDILDVVENGFSGFEGMC